MNKLESYKMKMGSLNRATRMMAREVNAYLGIIDERDKTIAELKVKLDPEHMEEWSSFDFDEPASYPPKEQCYLCLTVFGKHIELCWNAFAQRWVIPGSNPNEFFNPFQIDYYMPLPMPPKKVGAK